MRVYKVIPYEYSYNSPRAAKRAWSMGCFFQCINCKNRDQCNLVDDSEVKKDKQARVVEFYNGSYELITTLYLEHWDDNQGLPQQRGAIVRGAKGSG